MNKLVYCFFILLFFTTAISAQSEVDSLMSLASNGNLSKEEKRKIGLRILEIRKEKRRTQEDRYLERTEPLILAIPDYLDTLIAIAQDTRAAETFREKSVELLAESQTVQAYNFLIDNLTDLIIVPSVIPGEEPYFRMRYCFHVLYQMPDRKHLLPLIFSNLDSKQRSDEYCRFIAILLNKENKELIKGWGQVYSTTTESLFFAENWQKVCSHLTP